MKTRVINRILQIHRTLNKRVEIGGVIKIPQGLFLTLIPILLVAIYIFWDPPAFLDPDCYAYTFCKKHEWQFLIQDEYRVFVTKDKVHLYPLNIGKERIKRAHKILLRGEKGIHFLAPKKNPKEAFDYWLRMEEKGYFHK